MRKRGYSQEQREVLLGNRASQVNRVARWESSMVVEKETAKIKKVKRLEAIKGGL